MKSRTYFVLPYAFLISVTAVWPVSGAGPGQPARVAQLSAGQTGDEPLSRKPAIRKSSSSNRKGTLKKQDGSIRSEAVSIKPRVEKVVLSSRDCVALPFEFSATGSNLDQGSVQCKTDCAGPANVTTARWEDKIKCRYDGSWNGNQSCRVGVVAGGAWSSRSIQICGSKRLAAKAAGGGKMTRKGAPESGLLARQGQGSLLQKEIPGATDPFPSRRQKDEFGGMKKRSPDAAGTGSGKKALFARERQFSQTGSDKPAQGLFGAKVRKQTSAEGPVVASTEAAQIGSLGAKGAALLPQCPDEAFNLTQYDASMYRCELPSYEGGISPYEYLGWLENQECMPGQHYNVGPVISHNLMHEEIGSPIGFWFKFTCHHSDSGGGKSSSSTPASAANDAAGSNTAVNADVTLPEVPECPQNYFLETHNELLYRCVRFYTGYDRYAEKDWLEQQPCDVAEVYNLGPKIVADLKNEGPWGYYFRFTCRAVAG